MKPSQNLGNAVTIFGHLSSGNEFVTREKATTGEKCHNCRLVTKLRYAFTLVELLVVIAILAVLAGLLLPVLAQSREKARQAACLNNLHQIGVAILQYAQDWDETLPVNAYQAMDGQRLPCIVSVGVALNPFLGDRQALRCPTQPDAFELEGFLRSVGLSGGECDSPLKGGSYALNQGVFVAGSVPALGIPSQKPVHLSEILYDTETATGYDGNVALGNNCNFRPFEPALQGRHQEGLNAAFLDGHVKWQKAQASGCLTHNINGNPLAEACLAGDSPYRRPCHAKVPFRCPHHLSGVPDQDAMGWCVRPLR